MSTNAHDTTKSASSKIEHYIETIVSMRVENRENIEHKFAINMRNIL